MYVIVYYTVLIVTLQVCKQSKGGWWFNVLKPAQLRFTLSLILCICPSCCCGDAGDPRSWAGDSLPAEGGKRTDVRTPCKPPIHTSWNICRRGTTHFKGVQRGADTTVSCGLHWTPQLRWQTHLQPPQLLRAGALTHSCGGFKRVKKKWRGAAETQWDDTRALRHHADLSICTRGRMLLLFTCSRCAQLESRGRCFCAVSW